MYPNNYNYYQQPQSLYQQAQPVYQQPSSLLKGRPVSSVDEAKVANIDFDGSIFYFPDLAHNRIYTKQIRADGTATLLMYELKEIPVAAPVEYVTKKEFEDFVKTLGEKEAKTYAL